MDRSAVADLPIIAFPNGDAFAQWLSAQPSSSPGLWLKFAKKASGIASVSQQEAIDAALCHGWIDGQTKKFDREHWLIRFTPRRARSKWSAVNRARALELLAEGRIEPRGLQEIDRAKADGRWDAAYAPASRVTVPDDLKLALERNEAAGVLFAQLDSQNRYAILHRIEDAKKAETRASRIEKYVAMLGRSETPYPRKR